MAGVINLDPCFYHEISREGVEEYRDSPRRFPDDHHRWYLDVDGYYQTYNEGDPMVDNRLGPPGFTGMDGGVAGTAGESSSDDTMGASSSPSGPSVAALRHATRLPPLLASVPFLSTTANQSEVISEFLREVAHPPSQATGDLAARQDALSNLLGGGQPQAGNVS